MAEGDEHAFDLIVVGAGINGAAVAREAALSGLSVLLLEQDDLGGGTSSASSRLIHGGLRYLEHGELKLVRQSLAERERLLRAAPHLVEPLALYIPFYARSRRRPWQIRVGLGLYDLLARHFMPGVSGAARRGRMLPRHEVLSRAQLLERLPALDREGLLGGALYFDARVNFPERLVVENVIDAVDHGARLKTYTRVTHVRTEGGRVRGVEWRDADGACGTAAAPIVVNATGPWVDALLGKLGQPRLVGGTKGSHIIVEPFPGAPAAAVYAEAASDGRPFFIIPWNGLYLIGTTDERYEGDPADASISDHELEYLMAETARLFPDADLAGRVLYTQAAVRPLPRQEGRAEGAITRRHHVVVHGEIAGLYSLVGGKLTTHRALAEELVARLPVRRATAVSPTRELKLPNALSAESRTTLLAELGAALGETQAARLWSVYGEAAWDLLTRTREHRELADVVCPWSGAMLVEVLHALDSEWARTLVDILHRRCMAGLGPDFGLAAASTAADRLQRLGLWDRARAEQEIDSYRIYAARHRARAWHRNTQP